MPRPVDPKFGQDGYERNVDAFEVDADQLEPILFSLGLDQNSQATEHLLDALLAIGARHRRWKKRGPQAFSRAEARKALEMVLKLDRIDGPAITALNERALHLVLDQLLMMKLALSPQGTTVWEALSAHRIDDRVLRLAAQRVVKELKAQKGADRDGGLAHCVQGLCEIYETLAGEPVTLSNKTGRNYSRTPSSKAGKFVHACYQLIDPAIPGHRLNGHIREWIEARPSD